MSRAQVTRCEVTATELDEAGCGVGRADDESVHVVDLLTGEHAEVAIDHRSRHRPDAWGRVVRRMGALGFLVTAYPTDSIKAGATVWTRSS